MTRKGYVVLLLVGLGMALVVALFSPLASSEPDGLERVAAEKGFVEKERDAPYEVIADYVFPWVENENLSTILAGVVGVLAVAAFVLILGLGLATVSRRGVPRQAKNGSPGPPASTGGATGQGEP